MRFTQLGLWLTIGCTPIPEKVDETCQDLCDELVMVCGFDAYPSKESCTQGCAYNQEKGADTQGQLECVQAADCALPQIVECEHAFGPPAEANE